MTGPPFGVCDRKRERRQFFWCDAALERDALDAQALQPADHFAHGVGRARQRRVADDDLLADDADRDGRLIREQLG